jgi:hypothetical protein
MFSGALRVSKGTHTAGENFKIRQLLRKIIGAF